MTAVYVRHSHNAQVSNVERSNTRVVILLPRICGKIGFPTYQCFERKRSKGGNTPIGLGVRFSHSLLKAAGKETFLRLFLLSGCADNAAYFSQSSQFSYDRGTEMDFRVASLEWNTDLCRSGWKTGNERLACPVRGYNWFSCVKSGRCIDAWLIGWQHGVGNAQT